MEACLVEQSKRKVEANKRVATTGRIFLTAEQAKSSRGEVVEPIVSWHSFRCHWATHFPKLKVRAKGEGTCANCYLLKLKLARFAKQKAQLLDTLDDNEIDGVTPEDLAEAMEGYDEVIKECKKHVEIHTAQREQFNDLKEEALRNFLQDLPLHLSTLLLVINMGQNVSSPHLGGEQWGNFYYMSPITRHIFGVAFPAEQFMNTYI